MPLFDLPDAGTLSASGRVLSAFYLDYLFVVPENARKVSPMLQNLMVRVALSASHDIPGMRQYRPRTVENG
jgi:hypothetical protein